MQAVMKGVRVLELAAWVFVPIGGAVLGEWGADVLKIEHPETGDPVRGLVTAGGTATQAHSRDPAHWIFEYPNRCKRSVAIDVSTEIGRGVLLELAKSADVFITSLMPRTRKKLGIDVEDLRSVNPSIIYARGSALGQYGAGADRGGYDQCSFWARGGAADLGSPDADGYPADMPGGAFGDAISGFALAGGIAAALHHRAVTGEPTVVDTSLFAMGAWASGFSIAGCAALGIDRLPVQSRTERTNPIVNAFRTSDNRFVQLVMLQSDRYWAELVTAMGRPDLADDQRFSDSALRAENKAECVEVLDKIFEQRTFSQWAEILQHISGIWDPVQTPGEVLQDPDAQANGYVQTFSGVEGRTFTFVSSPIQFDGSPQQITRAPGFGEHTDEVLLDAGYEMDALIEMKIAGAIG
ncbi:MAG TPA: CoA transferase [Mycobacterium sp.]|jgi:crotonobetainyl-CoA:carnitine CoA-transferase CaiB-like acyl-CoA transferase|nr:CoA transferase [Mycobacterium sp.]